MLRFAYALVVVVLATLAAVAVTPPFALRALIPESLRSSIAIVEASGGLARGRMVLLVNGVRVPLGWELDPAPLLQGRLAATIRPYERDDPLPRGRVGWSMGKLALDDVVLVLPARAALPPARAADGALVGGELRLEVRHLEQRSGGFDGSGRVAWQGARLVTAKGAPVIELGDVDVVLGGSGARLAGTIANRGGALALAGEFGVGPDGALRASVLATPRNVDDRSLVPALAALGRPEGPGWRLVWPAGGR